MIRLIRQLPISLVIVATPLYAEQKIQEEVLVTGSYSPLTAEQLSSTVTVVDHERIVQLNKTHLAELLQSVAGVLLERQGGPGGLAVASIRGGESNYTVVMVDGVALNDPGNSRGGAFDLGNINVESIERIEVVKGPQSAVYGADALAGVINIISLRPKAGHQQTLSVSYGDAGFRQLGGSALGATDKVDYALHWRGHDSGEAVEGSEAEHNELNFRMEWRPATAHRVSVGYRYFDGERSSYPEQSGGSEFAGSARLDNTDYTDKSMVLSWHYQINNHWKSEFKGTRYQREELFDSPGIAPYTSIPPNGAVTEFEREQVSWINTLGQPDKFWADLGWERRMEEGTSRGYLDLASFVLDTDFSLSRRTDSGFIRVSARPIDSVLLQAGLRYDDTDEFDGETSSHLGFSYQASKQLTLRANVGDGYKLPSFFALGHPLVGNQDLKPERVQSWDVGIEWRPSVQLSTSLVYFNNAYRDPIDFDSALFTNVNRERIDTSGLEWLAQWSSKGDRLELYNHITYTDIDVEDSVSVLTGRPEWRAGVGLSWRFSNRWRVSTDYHWVGEQFATSHHTGDALVQSLDDYHRVDATLFWRVSESLEANVTVQNLFDSEYETAVGFPAPQLQWRVELHWQPQW